MYDVKGHHLCYITYNQDRRKKISSTTVPFYTPTKANKHPISYFSHVGPTTIPLVSEFFLYLKGLRKSKCGVTTHRHVVRNPQHDGVLANKRPSKAGMIDHSLGISLYFVSMCYEF